MHFPADPVSHQRPYYEKASLLNMRLHRVRDVSEAVAGPALADGALQRLPGNLHQPCGLIGGFAYRHGDRRVCNPAIKGDAYVQADNVTLSQPVLPRDAMHHNLVGRGADGPREPPVSFESRDTALLPDKLLRLPVQLGCGDARAAEPFQHLQASCHYLARAADFLHLGFRLANYQLAFCPVSNRKRIPATLKLYFRNPS